MAESRNAWRMAASACLLATACASVETPPRVLEAYSSALERGDYDAAYALTDAAFRASVSRAEFEAFVIAHPEAVGAFRDEWSGARGEQIILVSAQGRRAGFVLEGSSWRLASGGLEPGRWDEPLGALKAFFAAVRAGRLEEVRRAIPEGDRARYASDAALREHLDGLKARIELAVRAIGPLDAREVRIDGDSAQLVYGEGRAVRFQREQGVWRVLDLE